MIRKTAGMAVLVLSVAEGILLIAFSGNGVRYEDLIVDDVTFLSIMAERTENPDLIQGLVFEEESLFYDSEERVFYYSLVEGDSDAENPHIKIVADGDPEIVFLNQGIDRDTVEHNQVISFLAYSGQYYCKGSLKCTTLPLMSISCSASVTEDRALDEYVDMRMEIFDNRKGAASRLTVSEGLMKVRGAATRAYPKKGFRLSLTTNSTGGNVRKNHLSLLGMRQDEDWILYAGYNDQEKIRNVFSSNLWKYTCAEDNRYHVDTGMEYKYVELFLNGRYWGLYALGYPIDGKQMEIGGDASESALYQKVNWAEERYPEFYQEIYFQGYEMKNLPSDGPENGEQPVIDDMGWMLLTEYYERLADNDGNVEELYQGIDVDNAISCYLFINLIQGIDNANDSTIKNLYLALRREKDGIRALFAPWDMDYSWGNTWVPEYEVNRTAPYGADVTDHVWIKSGYLSRLMDSGDPDIWQAFFEKYKSLRAGGWSEETIGKLLDEYEADIYDSGAYLRDMERWPDGTYGDPAEKLDRFRSYVAERLTVMDQCLEQYKADPGSLDWGDQDFTVSPRLSTFRDLRLYIRALPRSGGVAVMEINDTALWNDPEYTTFLEEAGVGEISGSEDFLIYDFDRGTGVTFSDFHRPGNGTAVTEWGNLSLTQNAAGQYRVRVDDRILYEGNVADRETEDVKILLFNSDFSECIDQVSWRFDPDDSGKYPRVLLRECVRPEVPESGESPLL